MNSIPLSKASADSGENTKLIILISCVATIGGFLFGFDSGVINGTVDGLKQAFTFQSAGTGFEVGSMLLGCAVGAFFAGPSGRPLGPARGADHLGGAVPVLRRGRRRGQHLDGVRHRARNRRLRGRRGQRDVAGLHRRSGLGALSAGGWRRCSRS